MHILYCNVIEQNSGWGAEWFVNRALHGLGHTTTCVDFRNHRSDLTQRLADAGGYDAFFLQRGDGVSAGIARAQPRPRLFWASELVSRCRDQDPLLSSDLFDHVFFHSSACLASAESRGWVNREHASVLLNGFDPDIFFPVRERHQDIDVLFVGSVTSRRQAVLNELQRCFPVTVQAAYGKQLADLLRRSKVVLNIHAEDYSDTETRVFETLGSGAFLLSEELNEDNPFDDRHFVECKGIDELRQQLDRYLRDDAARRRIATAGHEEALAKHTYRHRAREIVGVVQRLLRCPVDDVPDTDTTGTSIGSIRVQRQGDPQPRVDFIGQWMAPESKQSAYLSECELAANGPEFERFKQNEAFREILEHVSEEQGWQYLKVIHERFAWLERFFPVFQENDRWGSPLTYDFGRWRFSPTTLRYIKVLGDLKCYFGSLDGFRIVEIGGGYGGQCKVIKDVFRPSEYVQIELPTVSRLQQVYLARMGVSGVRFATPDQIGVERYDLVISNYAFSELARDAQELYDHRILRHASRGYLTWNAPGSIGRFHAHDQLSVLPEEPQTGQHNRIVLWGRLDYPSGDVTADTDIVPVGNRVDG